VQTWREGQGAGRPLRRRDRHVRGGHRHTPAGRRPGADARGGAQVTALASILATGVSYRRLGAGRVDDYVGRGLFYGAAAHNAADCEGEDVYVVGAANSAGQAALYFA
jgi:thioredoxin reductase (NADPH)